MMWRKLIVSIWILCASRCGSDVLEAKTSIAFVIDNTASMSNDINQVKNGVNNIFHTVLEYNPNQFENFILITFNDPDVIIRTVTNNPIKFMNELSAITVEGGGDCPELSLKGIFEAILQSLPGSYIYVFTDATAKDYEDFERVKDLAQKKGCQIVFVLTGVCNSYEEPGYLVYPALAAATSGQVFHLDKNDVKKILNYVAVTVKSRKVLITNKSFGPGYGKHFNYTSDRLTDDVVVSVSGKNPKISIKGPRGRIATQTVVATPNISIIIVPKQDPGTFTAEVGSRTNTSVVVYGSSSVFFQHGFSKSEPFSLKDTMTKPIAGQKSHLAIKLFGGGSDFELKFADLMDINDNVIARLPLKLNNVKDRLYVSQLFDPPSQPFLIKIKGYDTDTMSQITRTSSTMVEPQTFILRTTEKKQKVQGRAPIIELEKFLTVDYGRPVELHCKITAYPEPCVQWEQRELDIVYKSNVSTIALPYNYMSTYKINAVTTNASFFCNAYNKHGSDRKRIDVITRNIFYFNFISYPNDTTIEYGKDVQFTCEVSAFPPVQIVWYRKGLQIFNDEFTKISENGSVLTIKHVTPKSEGRYSCEALNVYHREIHYFLVTALQPEEPDPDSDQILLSKQDEDVRVKEHKHIKNIRTEKELLNDELKYMKDRLNKLRKEVEDLEYIKKIYNTEKTLLNELKERVTSLERQMNGPVYRTLGHREKQDHPTKGF